VLLSYDRDLTHPRRTTVPTPDGKLAQFSAVSADGKVALVAWFLRSGRESSLSPDLTLTTAELAASA